MYIWVHFYFDLVLKGLLQKLCTNVRTASKQSMVCYKWFIIYIISLWLVMGNIKFYVTYTYVRNSVVLVNQN